MATLKKIIIIWFKVECLTNYFNKSFITIMKPLKIT